MSKSFTAYDVQKRKLEKLMSDVDKPVVIPERRDERKFPDAPEFVRNIMGSSAGAGSGEFHVYRHLRRKEYARQKFIKDQGRKEEADREFAERVAAKKRQAEERTAKKRAKRLKKKNKVKKKTAHGKQETDETSDSEDEKTDEKDDPDTKDKTEVVAKDTCSSGMLSHLFPGPVFFL